ncbi:MAG: sucrase ferredoxin [Actinomycetota bacterium]|nr:sucrase ferredoxin [Actinomycetota bacterium]
MIERFRCAPAALSRDEPLFATASRVRRWILVEQPGPWGHDAVGQSRLPHGVGAALRARARAVGARLLLIRRSRTPSAAGRACYVACTQPDRSWVERLSVDDVGNLLDLDLTPLRRDDPVGGTAVDHPVYLVCTNGRHDPCCAEFGRPLVQAMSRANGAVWECSHYGGDRFAGNLVCLPHGLYFGHVGPEQGLRIASAYQHGVIDLDHYRGRSCYPWVVQAAEFFVRARQDLRGVDDLRVARRDDLGGGRYRVELTGRAGRWFVVDLEVFRDPEGRLLTCRAASPSRPRKYRLVQLEAGQV